MKTKRLLAVILTIAMLTGCISAFASSEEAGDTAYYQILKKVDYQDKTAGTTGAQFYSTGAYQNYIADGNNIYMQAKSTISVEKTSVGLNYPNWPGNFALDTAGKGSGTEYITMGTSGEYVIEAKVMFHQNAVHDEEWADMQWRSIISLVGALGTGNETSIGWQTDAATTDMTNFCDDAEDFITLTGNNSVKRKSIGTLNTDVWYTIRETYNLETDTTSFEIVYPNGTSYKYTAADSRLSGANLSFVRWDIGIKKQIGQGFSIDDFTISKTLNKEAKVVYDSEKGSVSFGGNVVASNASFAVPYNSSQASVISIDPVAGYYVSDVKINGVSKGGSNELSLANVLENQNIEVEFAKITASTPYETELFVLDFQDKTVGQGPQYYNKGVYQKFIADGTNIYMQSKSTGTDGGAITLDYPNWPGNFALDTAGKGSGSKFVTMGTSGEYVIESRIMFHQSDVYDQTWADMIWYSNVSIVGSKGTGSETCIGWTTDGGSTAMTNFCDQKEDFISLKGNSYVQDKSIGVLETDVWYTIRETYNLENDTAGFEIIYPDGTSYKYENYDARLEGADLAFVRYNVGIKNINSEGFSMDDFKIKKTVLKPVKVTYDSTKGSVSFDGSVVESEGEAIVSYNSSKSSVLKINPKAGYRIADVKINGESKGNAVSSFEFKNVIKDQSVEVVFEEIPAENPEIAQTVVITSDNYNGHPAVFAYSRLNKFSNASSDNYGVYLWKGSKDATDATKVQLKVCDPVNKIPVTAVSEQVFGVMAYGAAINIGETYSVQPFVGQKTGEAVQFVLAEVLDK